MKPPDFQYDFSFCFGTSGMFIYSSDILCCVESSVVSTSVKNPASFGSPRNNAPFHLLAEASGFSVHVNTGLINSELRVKLSVD